MPMRMETGLCRNPVQSCFHFCSSPEPGNTLVQTIPGKAFTLPEYVTSIGLPS